MTVKRVGSISWINRRRICIRYFRAEWLLNISRVTRRLWLLTGPWITETSVSWSMQREGGRGGFWSWTSHPDQNASTTCIIWPSTSFASFASLRERTEAQFHCILPFSSSLISSRDSSSRGRRISKLETWKLWERRKGIVARIDVNRRPIILPGGDKVTIEENRTGFERGRNRVYISFRSFFSRVIRRYPRRIDIRVHPVLMQMSYGRPFGARTLHPVVARDRPADTDENPLSQFVLVVRCATPLNAACHLFDPLPHPSLTARALMPLLSPSSAPWQLLNCITYSPGIRINVWTEGRKKGKKKKKKKKEGKKDVRVWFFSSIFIHGGGFEECEKKHRIG